MKPAKQINYPKLSGNLAYLCGVLAGDGYIGIREHKYDYVVNCGGNPKDEKEFYDEVIAPLFFKLFEISIKPKLLGKTYGFNIWSKNLVEFLINEIGLPRSPKNNLSFPKIFYHDKKLALHFIRGVADTDFSFKLKRRNYPVISGSAKSKIFILEISTILKENGFKVVNCFDYKINDKRLKKGYNIINRVELNGHKQFSKWVNLIGTRQPKNRKKIQLWKN
ncbi:MAG: hypothetical protein ABIH82_02570, partial [Candidatus Woesearchaeota archaeon]|nr:hypothetical protein [Nanoarchaeota archaeon]